MADASLAGAKEITPLLSVQQTFSGLCFPVVTQFDIAKKPYREIVGPGDLGTWGPTSNTQQTYEEFSIGRGPNNRNPNAAHLPIADKSLGKADDSAGRGAGKKGLSANEEVFISETPYFKGIYKQVQDNINELSDRTPHLEIEDVSVITVIKESGLYAGDAEGLPLTAEIADTKTDKNLQDFYCIDINGYQTDAQAPTIIGQIQVQIKKKLGIVII